MDWDIILDNFDCRDTNILFRDKKYSYIEATYEYKGNQCMKYFILDFVHRSEYCEIDLTDLSIFREFQEKLLEEEFFHCSGDARFNLYLVFVVQKDSPLLENIDIQHDFTYARKIVLVEDEVENFFMGCFSLKRENPETTTLDISDKKEIMNQLYKSKERVKKIYEEELNCSFSVYYLLKKKPEKKFNKLSETHSIINKLDILMPNRHKEREKKKNSQERNKKYYEDCNIQAISDISIVNYRKYGREYVIPFKSVNLLYGENGTGKTSLLEAIEFGMTGYNRNSTTIKGNNEKIELKWKNQKESGILNLKNNYRGLAKAWYGINVETPEDFNNFFKQYNYFDTSWASVFAIAGKEQVNISQLKDFLNIEGMEECKRLLHDAYKNLEDIAKTNRTLIKKLNQKSVMFSFGRNYSRIRKLASGGHIARLALNNEAVLMECARELKNLTEEIEIITLENILSTHISKMNRVFKLLICSNEYSELKLFKGEIVAVRSGTKEIVTMSEMSTGQKVCLALSLMFSLFLSNENAPNIIMFDEPVANLDDVHMLNLLDVLRRFAMAGTQIFFTTSNPNVAKLFRRKFSYLENEFAVYKVSELDDLVKITYEQYDLNSEKPIKTKNL